VPEFSITSGEAVAILGPSGSGKSTLLDLIGGVLRPSAGRMEVFGLDAGDLSLRAFDRLRGDNVGLIFQEHNLLPFATVQQNVALGVQFSKVRRQRLADRSLSSEITRLLDAMDLTSDGILQRPASSLSVGQRQRVAAARALLGNPPLIIADEPTSALDEGNQKRFMELLQDARRASGSALLFVTHDPRLVEDFDRLITLDGGVA
jgi:putative ABC transport system ATP-binding protein